MRNTSIKISPNPATNTIHVQSTGSVSNPLHYILYDATGKLLLQGKNNNDNFNIDVHQYPAGVYIFKMYNAYQVDVSTDKIIIRK